jgi:site-specific DNA recombinase
MNTAVYLRVSTEEQAEKYGLIAQREQCEAMATVKGWDIAKVYQDDVSGTTAERPGLQAMLQAVCNGEHQAVIVSGLDRLARSTRLVLDIVEKLDGCSAELVSCKESLDTSTPQGRFVLRMFASLAELERDNIVERTTDGRDARGRIDGEKGGRLPMGYRRVFEDSKAVGVEVNEQRAELVRDIFAQRVAGSTLTAIADRLNEQGYTTERGGSWHASSVRQILLNEDAYKGGYRGESPERWPTLFINVSDNVELGG